MAGKIDPPYFNWGVVRQIQRRQRHIVIAQLFFELFIALLPLLFKPPGLSSGSGSSFSGSSGPGSSGGAVSEPTQRHPDRVIMSASKINSKIDKWYFCSCFSGITSLECGFLIWPA
jgi:hypothetical protein